MMNKKYLEKFIAKEHLPLANSFSFFLRLDVFNLESKGGRELPIVQQAQAIGE